MVLYKRKVKRLRPSASVIYMPSLVLLFSPNGVVTLISHPPKRTDAEPIHYASAAILTRW